MEHHNTIRLGTSLLAGLPLMATPSAQAHHLDGVLIEFNQPGFILDELNGQWATLEPFYDGGGFWRTNSGALGLNWIDAVQPANGQIHIQFDLLIIDSGWLGTTGNPAQETRLQIDLAGNNVLDESFANATILPFFAQTFGSTDGSLVPPGTGSTLFVENELAVYHFSMTFDDLSGGFGDVRVDWRATRGGDPASLPFGIDNLIVSGIPFDRDTDEDGVPDWTDNCVQVSNENQVDADDDNIGNACDADLNNDCEVSAADLGLLRLAFFSDDGAADFNTDGVVNFVDLGIMRAAFFGIPGPSGVGNACEL